LCLQLTSRVLHGPVLQPEELEPLRDLQQMGIYTRSHTYLNQSWASIILGQLVDDGNVYAEALLSKVENYEHDGPVRLSYCGKVR
jgi:hypothetical protein